MLLSIFDLAVGTDPITQWIKTSIDKWISGAQVLHLDPVSSLTGHTDPQLHKKYSLIPNSHTATFNKLISSLSLLCAPTLGCRSPDLSSEKSPQLIVSNATQRPDVSNLRRSCKEETCPSFPSNSAAESAAASDPPPASLLSQLTLSVRGNRRLLC